MMISLKVGFHLLSALLSNWIVMFLSFTTQICIIYGFPAPCAMTSSSDVVAYEDKAIGILILAAALEVASSPSGWARQCIALGLNPQGNAIFLPNISALVSTLETFRRIRGRILYFSYAVTFSRRLNSGYQLLQKTSIVAELTLSCPWPRHCNIHDSFRKDSVFQSIRDRELKRREGQVLVGGWPLFELMNDLGFASLHSLYSFKQMVKDEQWSSIKEHIEEIKVSVHSMLIFWQSDGIIADLVI